MKKLGLNFYNLVGGIKETAVPEGPTQLVKVKPNYFWSEKACWKKKIQQNNFVCFFIAFL